MHGVSATLAKQDAYNSVRNITKLGESWVEEPWLAVTYTRISAPDSALSRSNPLVRPLQAEHWPVQRGSRSSAEENGSREARPGNALVIMTHPVQGDAPHA